ncbi:MAG TPA: hypothetical protein VFG20_18180 [Planctomycetaceae bacterium]|nr:hypothetical protein [Planctomycetaceae bacterium]
MYDSWADSALESCNDGCGDVRWIRLTLKIIIAYISLAALSCAECAFRDESVEVEGLVEAIGRGPKPHMVLVRYEFTDPVTHRPRVSTTHLPERLVPKTQTATVQYIAGDMPSSRLKIETRTTVPSVFFWVNVVFAIAVTGLLGYLAWEANHPIPRPRNRVRNYPLR